MQGILATPSDARPPFSGVVVCHEHPLFGGNMDSPAVTAISRALAEQGIATVRFNFRNADDSTGGGTAEDITAALRMLKSWHEVRSNRCGVAGYSFGAAAIARGFRNLEKARAFALISPPLSALGASPIMGTRAPRLIISGAEDKIVPFHELKAVAGQMRGPVEVDCVPDTGHTLTGHILDVADRVAAFFGRVLR